MNNLVVHGHPPFRVAVLHGGPGAPGSVAAVAREMAVHFGVLEPLQTAGSVGGQIRELRAVLTEHAVLPVTLVGWSWGAMLGFVFAARNPSFVSKLVLVGSGPYEERYAAGITATRLERLSPEGRREAEALKAALDDPATRGKDALLARLGALFAQADAYDPLPAAGGDLPAQYQMNRRVWPRAAAMRRSGRLLALGKQITCPVVAIHGDYDPHPAAGVQEPLAEVLSDFRSVLLRDCGHQPWLERQARDAFFHVLREELRSP